MGCDVHLYVETRRRAGAFAEPSPFAWFNFGERIRPGRNYRVFEALAGVRGDEARAVVPPRGVPEDMGWFTAGEYCEYVVTDEAAVARWNADRERAVTRERAERWVSSGASVWVDGPDAEPRHGSIVGRITGPDWHTPSWLTTDEFARAIEQGTEDFPAAEWHAVVAAMRELERRGNEARAVFWFDN